MPLDFTPENLDRYFKKQLSEVEQKAVEQKMSQDPLLKSEIHFQEEVIEAICQRRKWEIKQRLDALAPESSPMLNIPRIAFGTTLTIAGLLTATLFWFDNKKIQKTENKPKISIVEEKQPFKITPKVTENTAVAPIYKPTPAPIAVVDIPVKKQTQEVENIPAQAPCLPEAQAENMAISTQEAFVKLYDEMLWFEMSNTSTDNGAFDRNSEEAQNLDRIVFAGMLRYQYYNEKLSLYNNASAGKEIHTYIDNKKRHFLLYEGIYYEFFDGQISETAMQPIRDKRTLEIVKDMIERNN